jgi:acyl dehydratase/NAD(P)-dependent dehydrogenase (short-subunit alcohol dehydrogenase family)
MRLHSSPMRDPVVWAAEALHVGLTAEFQREVTEEDVRRFAELSGDANPLHIDAEYASNTSYGRPIVHGAMQVAMASAMIGMHLPGRDVLLGGAAARFLAPLYYPTHVKVRGEVTSWDTARRSGQLRVTIQTADDATPTAEISLTFMLREPGVRASVAPSAPPERRMTSAPRDGRPLVIVTGAGGALGQVLAGELTSDHQVVAVSHRSAGGHQGGASGMEWVRSDLLAEDFEDVMRRQLDGRPLYAVVHAAWPGAPKGGLLNADQATIEHQLAFGAPVLIRLARLLNETVNDRGGRLIAIGSTAGSTSPHLATASYSLGKACLEHAASLLAPELARKRITVNVVAPSFMSMGINQHVGDRQVALESARVPLGRVCQPDEVAATVRFLLSTGGGFISGETIALTGGRLG